jgi:hypothetical protein
MATPRTNGGTRIVGGPLQLNGVNTEKLNKLEQIMTNSNSRDAFHTAVGFVTPAPMPPPPAKLQSADDEVIFTSFLRVSDHYC